MNKSIHRATSALFAALVLAAVSTSVLAQSTAPALPSAPPAAKSGPDESAPKSAGTDKAMPGEKPMAKNGKFHKLDANKDGMLSKDEVKGNAMLEKNFDAMDTDKDGQLSAQEQKAYMASHKAAKGGKDKSKPVS